MLKSSFINIEPKLLHCIEYKNFSFGIFKEDLSEALLDCRNAYGEFEKAGLYNSIRQTCTKKKNWFGRNNKPHITTPTPTLGHNEAA